MVLQAIFFRGSFSYQQQQLKSRVLSEGFSIVVSRAEFLENPSSYVERN